MAEKPVEKFQPSPKPSTETEQARLRHSLARAMAFVIPGLGHAFHGSIIWAVIYAAGFWFALYRSWMALVSGRLSYLGAMYGWPNELPGYVGWLGLAIVIWIAQLVHVTMMELND